MASGLAAARIKLVASAVRRPAAMVFHCRVDSIDNTVTICTGRRRRRYCDASEGREFGVMTVARRTSTLHGRPMTTDDITIL